MVPKIAPCGRSFKGAHAYYSRDKKSDTRERLGWTYVVNMPTQNPDLAVKIMAYTALNQNTLKAAAGVKATGRKLENPVFPFSLAWHPDEKPDMAHMIETALSAVAALGLNEHQALFYDHTDEPHPHVHIVANRVHPLTGKAASLSRSKRRLQEWALEYEKQHGKIYCKQREVNARIREKGRTTRYRDPVIAEAWRQSDNGRAFQAALASQGYTLANGNRRLVVVDRWGKIHNPARHIEGVRAADVRKRLGTIAFEMLPDAEATRKKVIGQNKQEYAASRRYDRWAAQQLNDTQDRQIAERAAQDERFYRMRQEKAAELRAAYKPHELRRKIEQLTGTMAAPSMRDRITGRATRDQEEREALRLQLADVERRTAEQMDAIENQHLRAVQRQAEQHTRERLVVHKAIEDRQPGRYREESVSARANDNARTAGRERGRDRGHDLEYGR
jgi:hypothetical protein